MSRGVPFVLAIASLVAAGCGLAVSPEPPADAGPVPDDAPTFPDVFIDPFGDVGPPDECEFNSMPPPGEFCAVVTGEYICGAPTSLSCFDNHWWCPVGTTRDPVCWCYGDAGPSCRCTPAGWDCGIDAGAAIDAGVVERSVFACGPITCTRYGEYCEHDYSDVAGVPDDYFCRAYTTNCAGSCSCFLTPGGPPPGCMDDGEGGVTVLGGGA